MTPQAELALLETAYAAIIANPINSYSIDGRTLTYHDVQWMTDRMDKLRVVIGRQTAGGVYAGQFRQPE